MEGGWWYVERGVIMFMWKVFQLTTETHQTCADSVDLGGYYVTLNTSDP